MSENPPKPEWTPPPIPKAPNADMKWVPPAVPHEAQPKGWVPPSLPNGADKEFFFKSIKSASPFHNKPSTPQGGTRNSMPWLTVGALVLVAIIGLVSFQPILTQYRCNQVLVTLRNYPLQHWLAAVGASGVNLEINEVKLSDFLTQDNSWSGNIIIAATLKDPLYQKTGEDLSPASNALVVKISHAKALEITQRYRLSGSMSDSTKIILPEHLDLQNDNFACLDHWQASAPAGTVVDPSNELDELRKKRSLIMAEASVAPPGTPSEGVNASHPPESKTLPAQVPSAGVLPSPSASAPPKPAKLDVPVFHPGRSRLIQVDRVSELVSHGDFKPSDTWIYGTFTVSLDHPFQSHTIIGAWPGGAITGSVLGSLLGQTAYKPTIVGFGWLFQDKLLRALHQGQKLVVSADKPARIFEVGTSNQGYKFVSADLITPPIVGD